MDKNRVVCAFLGRSILVTFLVRQIYDVSQSEGGFKKWETRFFLMETEAF